MRLEIASLFIFVFVSMTLFFRAKCPKWLKITGTALILFVSLKYLIYQLLGGSFFAPVLPIWFRFIMEALYGALVLLFFLLLLWLIYRSINWLMGKIGMQSPHLPVGFIKSCLVGLSVCLGFWGTWEAVKVPDVRTIELRLPNLPNALAGLNIVQLSDIHIGPMLGRDWLAEVVQKTNGLNPDIIALTGDFVDGHVSQIADQLEPLADLKAKYGVFGVTGNHEYYWNAIEWIEALKNLNITMLDNEHRVLDINQQPLVIAGLPDLIAGKFGHARPDLKKALADAPKAVRLLLSHRPQKAPEYVKQVDMQLSGHTHGGLMFFLDPLIAKFNNGFVRGMYKVDGKNLYVNSGTGLWNGFSVRIGVPSEITQFILAPEDIALPQKPDKQSADK